MNYVNDRFQELMGLEMNQKALEVMKKDVDAFMPGFSDSPENLSRWGHHYFCDDDGGRLIFDLNSPKDTLCCLWESLSGRDAERRLDYLLSQPGCCDDSGFCPDLQGHRRDQVPGLCGPGHGVLRRALSGVPAAQQRKMSSAKVTTTWCGAAVR